MRLTQQIFGQILDDPAADDRIIGHDQYGDNGVDPAAEAQSGPIAEGLIRADGAFAGHAADGGFDDNHRIAEGHGQDDIDQQENAAAVLCGQIGEAPDVPQPDGRARRGKDEADFARKGASFVLAVTHKNLLSLEAVSKIPGSSPPPACPPPRSQMKEAAKGLTDRAALPLLKGASDHAQPRGTKRDARLSTDEGAHCVWQRAPHSICPQGKAVDQSRLPTTGYTLNGSSAMSIYAQYSCALSCFMRILRFSPGMNSNSSSGCSTSQLTWTMLGPIAA